MSKYHKEIKPGVVVDVYDVLQAFGVESHAIGHAVKKLLMAGQRGTKDALTDLGEAKMSIDRAVEQLVPERSGSIDDDQEWAFDLVNLANFLGVKPRELVRSLKRGGFQRTRRDMESGA